MRISAKQYARVLYDLTYGQSKPEAQKSVSDFARYIYKERKLKLTDKIVEQFSKIYNHENGIVEAEVVTAGKISAPVEKKLKDYIEKKYHAEKVVLNNIVDENIKGGVIIKIGDEIIDGSLRGKLGELKRTLAG